jgi:hypothetical protein
MSVRSLRRLAFKILTVLACASTPAHAIEGMSLELGNGDGVDMGRVGVQWGSWKARWLQGANWHLGGYLEASIGYWRYGDATSSQRGSLVDLGLTPVLRVQPNSLSGPYVEAGLGVHLLSHSSIGDTRMSTAFQFGNHIGLGYRFGAGGSYDLGYRFQHLSNASIKRPNAGINFHQIRLQYSF